MVTIPKIATTTFHISGAYNLGVDFDPSLSVDQSFIYTDTPQIGNLPNAAATGQIDLSSISAGGANIRAFIGGRVWSWSVTGSDLTYQVSNDLSGSLQTIGPIAATIAGPFGPFSGTFTYAGVSRTLILSGLRTADADNGCLALGGALFGPTQREMFAFNLLATGGSAMMKAFPTNIQATTAGILGTFPYRTGSGLRYRTLYRELVSGAYNYYRVDWAPTAITNTIFDAVLTPITLSDTADQAVFSTLTGVLPKTLTSPFGLFFSVSSNTPSRVAKYFQFDSDLATYRELVPVGVTTPAITMLSTSLNVTALPGLDGRLLMNSAEALFSVWAGDPTDPDLTMSTPRVRAWGFSQDGHDFYVLRLADTETLVYDATTDKWMTYDGAGDPTWRAMYGINWQGISQATADVLPSDVIVGDTKTGTIWGLDPESSRDDQPDGVGSDGINCTVTTGFPARATVTHKNGRVFLALRTGDEAGAVSLKTSDDGGQTFQDQGTVSLNAGEYNQEVVWRSLGKITYPGRVFQFDDDGTSARLDGVDTDLDDEQ